MKFLLPGKMVNYRFCCFEKWEIYAKKVFIELFGGRLKRYLIYGWKLDLKEVEEDFGIEGRFTIKTLLTLTKGHGFSNLSAL